MTAALPSEQNLRERAVRSSIWTLAEYAASNVLRLGSNLVLAHLLFPEAFALLAYASIVLQGLQMLTDFGIGPAIVQSPRGAEPDFLNTAWTFQVVRGALLALVTALVSWPMSWIYDEPQLTWIVAASGLNFIVTGFQSTAIHAAGRALNLRRRTVLTIGESVLKALITIVWALLWPTVWALVGGALISYTVNCVLTHTLLPGIRNRFRWEPGAAKELMNFGGWILASTTFTFLASQADRLILGKLVSMHVLGVYSIALMFARLPYEVGARLGQIILFPALAAAARNDRDTLRAKLIESRGAILAVAQLGVVAVVIVSPWFFQFLYDDRYRAAAHFAPLLAGTVWFSILWASAYPALLAIDDARIIAVSNFVNLLVTAGGCLLGYQIDGMHGFIVGIGVGNLAGHAIVAVALARHGLAIHAEDALFTGIVALASAMSFVPPLLKPSLGAFPGQALLGLAGLAASGLFAYWRLRKLAAGALRLIRGRKA